MPVGIGMVANDKDGDKESVTDMSRINICLLLGGGGRGGVGGGGRLGFGYNG